MTYYFEYSTKSSTEQEHESPTEMKSLLVDSSLVYWNLRALRTYCCCWGGRRTGKAKQISRVVFILFLSCRHDAVPPTRSLRDFATQDTDKPDIQPVSESESLYSWVLS